MSKIARLEIRTNDGTIVGLPCASKREALTLCREYGDQASQGSLWSERGSRVALYVRDTAGNGRRWYSAAC